MAIPLNEVFNGSIEATLATESISQKRGPFLMAA